MKTEPIPTLQRDPFAPLEMVESQNLSAEDLSFLNKRERIIETGRKTFLEVGGALIDIRDYRDSLLYKQFGTFDAYCKERWDLGHSHAYRLMDAVEIYRSLSPRGDKSGQINLPETEKQLRPLKKLPHALRYKAWQNAVESAGAAPVLARHVEREVRKLMGDRVKDPPDSKKAGSRSHRIAAEDLEKILKVIAKIRKSLASGAMKRVPDYLDEVVALLPIS